jgi:hypothetical protein
MAKPSKKDPKIVKIGIGSPYDFFFEIAQPNLSRFLSDPSPVTAINAAWPLWHLHEWYYWERYPNGDNKKAFADNLIKNECPELGLFRDIADAAKHSRLDRDDVRVDAISIRTRGGAYGTAVYGEVVYGGSVTKLSIDVAGAAHDLCHAIGAAFRFWLGKVLPHHVKVPVAPDNLERSESMLDWCRERLGDERVRKWRWALLQGANAPHYIQRLAFLEADDADAFRRHFQV